MSEIEWKGNKYRPDEILNRVEIIEHQPEKTTTKLDQSTKVLQQGGNNTVNISYQVNYLGGPHFIPLDKDFDDEYLLSFINTFPEPRYKHFIEYLRNKAIKKFLGNKSQAARWLGMSDRRIRPSYIKYSKFLMENPNG